MVLKAYNCHNCVPIFFYLRSHIAGNMATSPWTNKGHTTLMVLNPVHKAMYSFPRKIPHLKCTNKDWHDTVRQRGLLLDIKHIFTLTNTQGLTYGLPTVTVPHTVGHLQSCRLPNVCLLIACTLSTFTVHGLVSTPDHLW